MLVNKRLVRTVPYPSETIQAICDDSTFWAVLCYSLTQFFDYYLNIWQSIFLIGLLSADSKYLT